MPKHATNSALFANLNCFRLRKQMACNKKATSRICFHENNSLTFALIYFHPPPSAALPSRGRVGNSLLSRPPTSLTLPRTQRTPSHTPSRSLTLRPHESRHALSGDLGEMKGSERGDGLARRRARRMCESRLRSEWERGEREGRGGGGRDA